MLHLDNNVLNPSLPSQWSSATMGWYPAPHTETLVVRFMVSPWASDFIQIVPLFTQLGTGFIFSKDPDIFGLEFGYIKVKGYLLSM